MADNPKDPFGTRLGSLIDKTEQILNKRMSNVEKKSVEEIRAQDALNKLQEKLEQVNKKLLDLEAKSKSSTVAPSDVLNSRIRKTQDKFLQINDQIEKAENRLSKAEQLQSYTASKALVSETQTATSPKSLSSYIANSYRARSSQGPAISMAENTGSIRLQKQEEEGRALLAQLGEELQSLSDEVDPSDPDSIKVYREKAKEMQEVAGRTGVSQRALSYQRQYGIDTESRYSSARRVSSQIAQQKQSEQISRDVSEGRYKRGEVEDQLALVTEKLVSTFNELDEAIKSTDESADDLAKKFEEGSEELDRLQNILKEMDSQGGGIGNKLMAASGVMGSGANILGAYANYTQYANVDMPMLDTQNRIGYGNIANQRYSDVQAAAGGDATALRRIRNDEYRKMMQNAMNIGEEQASVLGTRFEAGLAETGAQGTGSIGTAMMSGIKSGGNLAKAGLDVASAVANPLAQTAITGKDYMNNISQGQKVIQRYGQMRQYDQFLNAVPDAVAQRTIDTFKGTGVATRGLGGMRGATIAGLTNPDFVSQMAEYGLSQDDTARLTGQGAAALGKRFSVGDIARGGQLQRAGIMQSADQYIQARGALSSVGGDSNDLEEIMKNAVAAGMDNSKNIMEMVNATTQLSSRSAAMGIDAASGAATVMGRGARALTDMGVSENMANQAAALGAATADRALTSKSMSLGNVVESGLIDKQFGKTATRAQREAMKLFDTSQLQKLKEGGVEGADKVMLGLTRILEESGGQEGLDALLGASSYGASLDTTGSTRDPRLMELSRKKYIDRKQFTTEEQRYWDEGQAAAGIIAGTSGIGTAEALDFQKSVDQKDKYGKSLKDKTDEKQLDPLVKSTEDALAGSATFDAKQFSMGIQELNKTMGGLSELGGAIQAIASLEPSAFAKETAAAMEKATLPLSAVGSELGKLNTNLSSMIGTLTSLVIQLGGSGFKGNRDTGANDGIINDIR